MLKQIVCSVLVLVLLGVKTWVADPYLERKMDRLTLEDYNRYVTDSYPEFDPSLYDPVQVSDAGYGELSFLYVGPELLSKHPDPKILCDLNFDLDVIEIFHYNLFTNKVTHIA